MHYGARTPTMPVAAMPAVLGLAAVANLPVSRYSSGQRQRLRLGLALLDAAPVLMLDEPCANLDDAGWQTYRDLLTPQLPHRIVIIASNDPREYFCATQTIMV